MDAILGSIALFGAYCAMGAIPFAIIVLCVIAGRISGGGR